jgi:hypothetical protein
MKREHKTWAIDPELAERFNSEVRGKDMMPNKVLEELLKLWLEYILPKSRQGE